MHAFAAVCDGQGFSRAARQLNLSPPVVTRLVAGLEERLGVRLLHLVAGSDGGWVRYRSGRGGEPEQLAGGLLDRNGCDPAPLRCKAGQVGKLGHVFERHGPMGDQADEPADRPRRVQPIGNDDGT